MSASPQSPKRRHILSSINPEPETKRRRRRENSSSKAAGTDRRHSPIESAENGEATEPRENGDERSTEPRRRTKLKLKDHKSRSRRHRRDPDDEDQGRHHASGYKSRHRSHRRHRSPTPPNPFDTPALDPEAAFRESLFDAMADDEGAAYWEGVYGQPVHVYPSEKVGPDGELERMTDEEYASHVRQKMWEKTHAGLVEERERYREERRAKKEEEKKAKKLHEEMERSLRRGEERRRKRKWTDVWESYSQTWSYWDGSLESLPWPLEKYRPGDIHPDDVRNFFIHGLQADEVGEQSFVKKLRDERVRWHPDKIQQRLGGQVDEQVMKDVTAIFQIIDKLWSDARSKA